MSEKKTLPIVIITTVVFVLAVLLVYVHSNPWSGRKDKVLVGMICDGDESTPYSKNFCEALYRVKSEMGEKMEYDIRSNVTVDMEENVIQELIDEGCDIVITNSFGFGETAKAMAGKNPDVQFLQATQSNADDYPVLSNYHTFMGYICQGRYIAGQVAGKKLTQLIENGLITNDEAIAGYVAAYPYPEVISGYTAFFLGIRNQCPSAVMKVKYANTWTSYQKEYDLAKELIDEGCVMISQHSDTTGPAAACEEAASDHTVFHVGYNQSMISAAPAASLISTKIEWEPYIKAAVTAVLDNKAIESVADCDVYGQDAGAGFDKGWVRMLTLNEAIAAQGTQEMIYENIRGFKEGSIHIFKGDYKGVDPLNLSDTIDLNEEYIENESSSAPTFHYVIDGITVTAY